MNQLSKLGAYSKFITGIAGQALTYATLYYGTNHYVSLAVAIAGALGIYAIPNATSKGTLPDVPVLPVTPKV